MTERLLQKYVPSTKGTSHFGIVRNRNRWSVFEPSAITVSENSENIVTVQNARSSDVTQKVHVQEFTKGFLDF